jgi:serine/threonine protein kinase
VAVKPKKEPVPGYELLELLGEGGMATVFKARQRSSGRVCALKILRGFEGSGDDMRLERRLERFVREGKILERIDHPNIVRLLAMSQDPANAWLALEYVDGPSVEDLLERQGGPLPIPVVLAIMAEGARALSHLASRGVVHKDVKPGNLVVTAGGAIKLVDFGIASTMDETSGASDSGPVVAADMPIGTVDTMAPEQVEDDDVDHRADMFALGSTAYRCLAGMSPFTGETVFARLRELVERQPPPLPRNVPRPLATLVIELLRKEREARPGPNEILAAVESVAREKGLKDGWARAALAQLLAAPKKPRAAATAGPIVVVLAAPEKTIERALNVGEGYVIGRSLHDGQASTSIGKPWISRQHCRVEMGERGLVVTDLGSANGTFVNGLRLKPSSSALVRPGDKVQLGKTVLEVSLENAPAGFMQPAWKCLLCGVELPKNAASNDEATGVEERHLCARCRGRIEEDRTAAENRAREAIQVHGARVAKRFELGGPILRFEVHAPDGKKWAAHALDLGPSTARRYVELSRLALELDHPGILRARALREAKGVLVVISDPIAGKPAAELVLREGPLDPEPTVRATIVLARAYAHAREKGVTAFAIRPNLVLLGDGQVKALDVGLAPGLIEAGRSRVELGRSVPSYDAPEALGVRETQPQATVYSVAAVAHFLLTGEAPVELRSQGRRVRAPLIISREEVPAELAKILDAALDDDPLMRPESLEAFAASLEAFAKKGSKRMQRAYSEPTQITRAFDLDALEREAGDEGGREKKRR